jgi:hypothetical protein
MNRYVKAAAASAVLGVSLLSVAAGGGHIAPAAAPSIKPAAAHAPATHTPAARPAAPPPSAVGASQLGTTLTMTDDSSGTSYTVEAVRVQDPAQGANEFATPGPGHYFVGVEFTVTSVASQVNEAADLDAAVQGSNGQVYSGTSCAAARPSLPGTEG